MDVSRTGSVRLTLDGALFVRPEPSGPSGPQQPIERGEFGHSHSSGLLDEDEGGDGAGDYDRHLKSLRPVLRRNADRMAASVAQHFPDGTRSSSPVGGSVLWLELPGNVDSERLFDAALEAGISIAPGPVFSVCGRYRNFIRLSFGHPWSDKIEDSVRWLGEQTRRLADSQ